MALYISRLGYERASVPKFIHNLFMNIYKFVLIMNIYEFIYNLFMSDYFHDLFIHL